MSTSIHEPLPNDDTAAVYFRTVTGTRVHRPECPHLVGKDAYAAGPVERLQYLVCDWSRAQEEGYGREHFKTIEDAMRRVGVPVGAHDTVLKALRFTPHDEIFTVHSLTYGALAREGRVVAGFGKTYYWVGGRRVNLPSYVASSRSGRAAAQTHGEICPSCNLTMPLTGVCDSC